MKYAQDVVYFHESNSNFSMMQIMFGLLDLNLFSLFLNPCVDFLLKITVKNWANTPKKFLKWNRSERERKEKEGA
jgi:hypothetical protein